VLTPVQHSMVQLRLIDGYFYVDKLLDRTFNKRLRINTLIVLVTCIVATSKCVRGECQITN